MVKINIKKLSIEETKYVYDHHMPEDFPPAEVKPWAFILPLLQNGCYNGYGFFEASELLGYAFVCLSESKEDVLLDYYAVSSLHRNRKFGSIFLTMLYEELKGQIRSLIGEMENPAFAVEQSDKDLRQRRLGFYERNSWRHTGVLCRIWGIEYVVMAVDMVGKIDDQSIIDALDSIYGMFFSPEIKENEVRLRLLDS